MRTLELATQLREVGYRVVYACRRLEGSMETQIENRGFEVHPIEAPTAEAHPGDEEQAIVRAVEQFAPLLVVIDHYDIDAGIEARVRAACHVPLMCYDDNFETHTCDVLVNQNVYATAAQYTGKVPVGTELLVGIDYAALRSEFREAKRPRTGTRGIPRLLVTLGGSDPGNVTSRVLSALEGHAGPLDVSVVVGAANRHREAVEQVARRLKSCRVLVDVQAMAALMAEADIAVTAAGQTTIEALFMELPTINVMIADNQQLNTDFLESHGLSISLRADFDGATLHEAVGSLLAGTRIDRRRLAEVASRVGTRSVVAAVERLRFRRFSITPTEERDIQPLFDLANDPEVRTNSLSVQAIPWEDHEAWFQAAMHEPNLDLYTLRDACGEFMGQLRFDRRQEGRAVVSISIVKRARGYGTAPPVLRRAVGALLERHPHVTVEAVVKSANLASLRSFARAGFETVRTDADTVFLQLSKLDNDEN